MKPKHNSESLGEFFKNYEEKNPAYVLGLIVISLGLYVFTWIYFINKDLEHLDEDAPHSARGGMLIVVLPLIWFFLSTFIKQFINSRQFLGIEVTVYVFIYILALKYILDFCIAFSHVTKTKAIAWFVPIVIGTFGFFGYFFQSFVISAFVVVLVLTIPAMQAELNTTYHKISIKKNNHAFYS